MPCSGCLVLHGANPNLKNIICHLVFVIWKVVALQVLFIWDLNPERFIQIKKYFLKNNRFERKGRIIDFSQNLFTKIPFFQWFIFEKVMFTLNFDLYDGDLSLSWWKQQIAEMMKTKKQFILHGNGTFFKNWKLNNKTFKMKFTLPFSCNPPLFYKVLFFWMVGSL